MGTKKTVVGFKMAADDGFFFRWTSPDRALEAYSPVVRAVRIAGGEHALAEPTVTCATFPRVDHGPESYQGMVLGYAILTLPEATYDELARAKEVPAEYTLVFQARTGEPAREGIDYQLVRRTPATAFFVAEIPAV